MESSPLQRSQGSVGIFRARELLTLARQGARDFPGACLRENIIKPRDSSSWTFFRLRRLLPSGQRGGGGGGGRRSRLRSRGLLPRGLLPRGPSRLEKVLRLDTEHLSDPIRLIR